ncbi:hypothetical protein JW977_00110 [Candidatus Falkowbacteria bacterium]|nr:hypothetical protein [Candidatus Falkowbacteria bacterium]
MKNFKRILELIRKTGDRFIFEDEDGQIFVIMDIDDYEGIVLQNSQVSDLTEKELLNKINKDIAVWRDLQKVKDLDEDWQNLAEDNGKDISEDQYYLEPTEDEE